MTRAMVRATAQAFGASAFAARPGRGPSHGQRRPRRGAAELRSPDRPAVRHLSHRLSRVDAVRPAIQDRRLHGGRRRLEGPPIAAMYMPSFTHTRSTRICRPRLDSTNDNLVSQQVSGFIAGQLYGNLGSFIQITGNPTPGFGVKMMCLWTPPTSGTPTLSRYSARKRSGASTPTIRRPWKTLGTRRLRLVGRRSPRPSRPPSVRR